MGCHALLQGIFPTQGLNPGLLHYRRILDCLSHQGSPRTQALELSRPLGPWLCTSGGEIRGYNLVKIKGEAACMGRTLTPCRSQGTMTAAVIRSSFILPAPGRFWSKCGKSKQALSLLLSDWASREGQEGPSLSMKPHPHPTQHHTAQNRTPTKPYIHILLTINIYQALYLCQAS